MKTTGAREMVPGVESAEGSSRLAYSDIIPAPLDGVDSGAMVVVVGSVGVDCCGGQAIWTISREAV